VLAAALVWAAITLAPADDSDDADHSIAGGILQIAPLAVAVPGPGATDDLRVFDSAVRAGYRWGFSVGLAFEPVEHLLISASAGLNQSIWTYDNDAPGYELCFADGCYGSTERGLGHLIRIGPELRVGWTSRWWMAWALFGAHVGLSRVRLACDNSLEAHCARAETDVGVGLGGGLGLAIRPQPRFAIGLETGIVHTRLERRNDPFEAARSWELGLVAIIGF
jgi:hypothetical protein